MIDRNVEYPSRFRLTKVEGTDDIYDLIPTPGDVVAEGDTFSKANLLPDSIPALLGLKMANPQVKDALNVLANIGNVHVWARKTIDLVYEAETTTTTGITNLSINNNTVYYSNSITVENGEVVLVNPVSIVLNGSNTGTIKGKYINSAADSAVYYVVSTGTVVGNTLNLTTYKTQVKIIDSGVTDFVTSTDPAAYPQDGDVGEYHYTYLGQLGEPGAKIEVGSYVGTGTYGASNKTSIPINKTTKFVIVQAASPDKSGGNGYYWMLAIRGNTKSTLTSPETSGLGNYMNTLAWGETTLSWYSTYSNYNQLNSSAVTYIYIPVG